MARMPIGTLSVVTALFITSSGCGTTWLKLKNGRQEPVSSPVEERPLRKDPGPTRYAEQNAPQTQPAGAPAESDAQSGDDPQLANLQATFQQYQARFPNPDGTLPSTGPIQTGQVGSPPQPAPHRQTPTPQPQTGWTPLAPSSNPTVTPAPGAYTPAPLGVPSAAENTSPALQTQTGAEPSAVNPTPSVVANEAVTLDAVTKHESPVPTPLTPALPAPQSLAVELIDVRPAVSNTLEPQPVPLQANEPTAMPAEPVPLTEWITQLEEDVTNHPQHMDSQFRLRLLYLATDQDEKATRPLENVDPLRGELLTALCQALTTTRQAIEDPITASQALQAVNELQRLIREQSPVLIQKLALVTRVNSFGDYEAVDPARFSADVPIHVFCYTEVANFRSEPIDQGRLRTVLAARMEIFDTEGKILWQRAVSNIEDRVLTPRRDFFVPLEIKLPTPLPVGDYILKVTIEDVLGATTDQQRLRFEVSR